MKKILCIGGNHPRHLYYFNKINEIFPISGAIIEEREELLPQIPKDLESVDEINFKNHFEKRQKAEIKYFGAQKFPEISLIKIERSELNSQKTVDYVEKIKPDMTLIFGSGMIKKPLLSTLPKDTINLHLGISPRYRGSATLFWPFYFMEPNYAGSTFHHIISEPDAGEIIHQVLPYLEKTDGIHDVACKTVIESAEAMIQLIDLYLTKGNWSRHSQKGTGKNFLSNDFKPHHLRVIYNVFNDNMVKEYLEGKIQPKIPNIIDQFRKK